MTDQIKPGQRLSYLTQMLIITLVLTVLAVGLTTVTFYYSKKAYEENEVKKAKDVQARKECILSGGEVVPVKADLFEVYEWVCKPGRF